MNLQFLFHLLITSCIFYIITTGFKFFLKLRMNIDFSYMAIVLFGSYTSVLINIHRGIGILASMMFSWIITLPFTLLIMYLSKRLESVYFIVGTLALYMFFFQGALNWESMTGGAFGLSGMQRVLMDGILIHGLGEFLLLICIITALLVISLSLLKHTIFFTLLKGWGENSTILRIFGIQIHRYTLIMIIITSLCAVMGGNLYAFYFLFIDPRSFWLSMLVLVLVIGFLSYDANERQTLLIAIVVIFVYEYLRFFKVVDPAHLGYLREGLFALIIMVTSYITFKRISFGRMQ